MNLRDLTLRARALFAPKRAERDLHDELSFHIEREAMKLMEQGLPPEDARARAQAKFGSTTVAADECRDERGTAFIDNTIGDLQYALRTFRRAPLAALTIVVTVAIGLGVVAVLFTVLNVLLFRTDSVPDITEIYAVERPQQANGDLSKFTRQRFEALRSETNVFTEAYAALNEVDLRVDGRMMAVNLVSASFFRVVSVNPIMGRALSAADDDRAGGNPVLVLSDTGWQRQFNRDPNVIGRTVLVTGAPYEIVGVMPEGFRGLEVSAPDFWAPLARVVDFVPDVRGSEDKVGIEIIGRLKPGVSMESARAQLAAWDSNQSATTDRTMSIELCAASRHRADQPLEAIAVFTPLFFAFGLILLIGCANVANLLLARGVARQREIGIRLSIGASRRRIVRQLLTESVLLALAAAGGGYLVSRLALEGAVYWAMRTMPVDLGDVNLSVPAADWRVALFLVLAAIAATAFFALVPALQATRIEPVRTLRGELVKDARPGRARNILIGVQVFASALLLICSAIFLRSAISSSEFNPGFRTADTLLIDAINDNKRDAMLQALASDPTVTAFAGVRPPLLALPPRAFGDAGAGKVALSYKHVSAGYFDVLGVPIVRGRAFTTAESDEHPVAVVSESVARTLWPNGDGVGETFRIEPDLTAQQGSGFLTINPEAGAGERAVDAAHGHGHRRLERRRRFSCHRCEGSRRIPADHRRCAKDLPGRSHSRRSRPGAANAARATHQDRSEHGHDHDPADRGEARDLLPEDGLLGVGDSRRARAVADRFGALQRVVVSGRAAHQGDRRADRAGRLVSEGDAVDVGANHPASPVRAAGRCWTRRVIGDTRARNRSRRDDF